MIWTIRFLIAGSNRRNVFGRKSARIRALKRAATAKKKTMVERLGKKKKKKRTQVFRALVPVENQLSKRGRPGPREGEC